MVIKDGGDDGTFLGAFRTSQRMGTLLKWLIWVAIAADGVPSVPPISESSATSSLTAERNSALAISILHFFVVFSAPALLWNSPVVDRDRLIAWAAAEALLGFVAFVAFLSAQTGHPRRFVVFSRLEGIGTMLTFSALPWLSDDIAESTPSKHVLMIALVAVTSISAANSSHITRRRPLFGYLVVMVALSYFTAFATQGEWIFATLTLLWCVSIAMLTRVGYNGMLELLELRSASERTARHDDLTGLLSRTAFFEQLDAASANQAEPGQQRSALVLFDLDGFKAINDTFGHPAGDAVLRAVAERLELFLPGGSTLARLGGDEFAAIVRETSAGLDSTISSALSALSEPVRLDTRELYVAASAGWTAIDGQRLSAELVAEADAALYQSKRSETAAATGFDTALRDELERSLDMRQRFRTGLKRKEIEFFAQPLVRMADSAPVGVELLARWPQEDSMVIGPLEFTRVADETGLAVELDRQTLAQAHAVLASWGKDPLLSQLRVKANISPVHLHNSELLKSVQKFIPEHMRNRLGLEFVESRLISAAERNHSQLRQLMDMGIVLSIDDFGVGYSSLTYLRSLPISEIKIDRSFVTAVDSDPINQGLIRAIVDIAATLGLPTVAEGIETAEEFAAAARLGVSAGQGYFIGHPLPIDEAEDALRSLYAQAASFHSPG